MICLLFIVGAVSAQHTIIGADYWIRDGHMTTGARFGAIGEGNIAGGYVSFSDTRPFEYAAPQIPVYRNSMCAGYVYDAEYMFLYVGVGVLAESVAGYPLPTKFCFESGVLFRMLDNWGMGFNIGNTGHTHLRMSMFVNI